ALQHHADNCSGIKLFGVRRTEKRAASADIFYIARGRRSTVPIIGRETGLPMAPRALDAIRSGLQPFEKSHTKPYQLILRRHSPSPSLVCFSGALPAPQASKSTIRRQSASETSKSSGSPVPERSGNSAGWGQCESYPWIPPCE